MLGSLPDLDFMANCIIMKQAVPQLLDIWIRTLLDALHAIRVNKLKSFCGGYDRLSKWAEGSKDTALHIILLSRF